MTRLLIPFLRRVPAVLLAAAGGPGAPGIAIAGSGLTLAQPGGRSLVVDGGLVLVLFGAALFAICRASRRV